jgi:hypothetical protein
MRSGRGRRTPASVRDVAGEAVGRHPRRAASVGSTPAATEAQAHVQVGQQEHASPDDEPSRCRCRAAKRRRK